MRTYDQVVSKLLRRPGVKKEVERLEREEGEFLDQLLKARHGAGRGLHRPKLQNVWELSRPPTARISGRSKPTTRKQAAI